MSSWTQSSISLEKLCEIQKPTNDRTGLGFNTGESSSEETCTQSNLAHDKFKKMSFVKASVIHDPCESVRYDDQISELLNKKGKAGIGYDRPESPKSGWLKNRLDKEKAKAGSNSFVQNQHRRDSRKVKSVWKKIQPRRDPIGQNIKPKLDRSHRVAETAQNETDEEEQNVDGIDVEGTNVSGTEVGEQTVPRDEETDQWFNLSYEEFVAQDADRPVVIASDTDEEMEIVDFGTGVGEQQLQIFDEDERSVDASAAYIVTEPEAETLKDQGMDIPDVVPAVADKVFDDESMTLEEILLTIPADCPLPSAFGEITKIKLGKSISIPGVNEGDWYKARLPKIYVDAKGKAPLVIVDPVKGNTSKEQFSLICADIEVLVQLREKVIDEVEQFFNYFSLKKLAVLKIEDFYAKEEKVLTWAETDSTREALQRRMYILTKYKELLTRKSVEAYKSNFVPGEG
ncbi:hypothetical protein F511_37777 [Dorcoceras hygrometricum]|uniref:Splicing factor 3B subunit 1-like n=1 Tax=Dorcoceras hygrometricum TaxID=472368 RepID=A0A2Z7BQB0_9LAMI|nr:hypothetical protein F511_37777 [Dorcoceras hygrometricum]